MATTTPNFGWPVPTSTDYVKDGASSIEALGDAIDATVFGLGTGAETVLSSGAFTTSSALNLSNVLSSTYKFYNFYFYAAGTTNTNVNFRFRENTTDKASNYYGGGNYGLYSGATGNWFNANNAAQFGLNSIDTNTPSTVLMKIVRPDATLGMISYQTYDNKLDAGATFSGIADGMTNFTGISLYPVSGTFTGYYILTGVA
jgi:hypothetical protein